MERESLIYIPMVAAPCVERLFDIMDGAPDRNGMCTVYINSYYYAYQDIKYNRIRAKCIICGSHLFNLDIDFKAPMDYLSPLCTKHRYVSSSLLSLSITKMFCRGVDALRSSMPNTFIFISINKFRPTEYAKLN